MSALYFYSQHVLDPKWFEEEAPHVLEDIENAILEIYSPVVLEALGLDLSIMQLHRYGTLQVWELAIAEKRQEQLYWSFILFTYEDMAEDFGHRILEVLRDDHAFPSCEDSNLFAGKSGRQDLFAFPSAARNLARAIPSSLNCDSNGPN